MTPVKTVKLAIDPSLLKDRMVLVEHLNAHISETHGDQWSRAPRGSILTFLKENVRWTRPHRRAVESVRRALLSWRKRRLADKGHCPQSRTLTLKDTPILKGSRFVWTEMARASANYLNDKIEFVEVLSYKMEIEESGACKLISRAMNIMQEVALQQTELQAWEAISGQIASLNAKASFQTALAAVAADLDVLAEDPDLIEMFDLIVSRGGKESV